MDLIGYLDYGMSYVKLGTNWVRDFISNLIQMTGFSGRLGLTILLLISSIFLSRLIVKGFVTKPLSGNYLIRTILIAILIFLVLMYI